jgi:hypothetical protein
LDVKKRLSADGGPAAPKPQGPGVVVNAAAASEKDKKCC